MNWLELERDIDALAAKINYQPDSIVAIVRGGLIPARVLAQRLNVKDMHALTVRKIGQDRKVSTSIDEDLSGQAILLIEDALETGNSLKTAGNYLEAKGATVNTAALFVLEQSVVIPDFYISVVSAVPTFPWD